MILNPAISRRTKVRARCRIGNFADTGRTIPKGATMDAHGRRDSPSGLPLIVVTFDGIRAALPAFLVAAAR